ncbi:MAG: hypothetical protein ACKV2T_33865 [Kofleriaceae bacterium]
MALAIGLDEQIEILGSAREAVDRDNIERVKWALRSVFDDPCIDDITAEDLLGEYPAIQYNPPDGTFHIDLLTRLGELYDFALESERKLFGDLPVTVVTPKMLVRMKRGTVRPHDWARVAKRFKLEDE